MGINFNDITFFKTAQGSKYIRLPDGRLRRWKSSHANTGGEDMGLHGWSSQSIFVDPKFEYPANSIQYLVGKGYKVALSKDAEGKMFPMIVDKGQWRPATWGDAYSVYARQNPEVAKKVLSWKYSKEPIVGYHVVDFDLKGGDRGTEIKGYHFGSPVSEIGSLSDEDKKLFFPSQSNLQESVRKVLNEYSDNIINRLIEKFKNERPGLTNNIIRVYINRFYQIKNNPNVTEKDIFKYTWKELETVVDANQPKRIKAGKINDGEPLGDTNLVYNQDGLRIYLGRGKKSCIKYGNGYSFCISSRGEDNMFNFYRFEQGGTPYFVFDDTKTSEKNENDEFIYPEHLLVIFVYESSYTVTTSKNSNDEYFGNFSGIEKRYPRLKGLGSIFKNVDIDGEEKKEKAEYELVEEYNNKLEELKNKFPTQYGVYNIDGVGVDDIDDLINGRVKIYIIRGRLKDFANEDDYDGIDRLNIFFKSNNLEKSLKEFRKTLARTALDQTRDPKDVINDWDVTYEEVDIRGDVYMEYFKEVKKLINSYKNDLFRIRNIGDNPIQESIKRILRESNQSCNDKDIIQIANHISDKLHCDVVGSCVHFAELFVEKLYEINPQYLNCINVVEGYVDTPIGDGIPQQHTWVELNDGTKIDPTFLQFTKYGSARYMSKKRTYTGVEYYEGGIGGTWFSEKRKKHPKMIFKEQEKTIYKILMENKIPDSPQQLIKSLPQELKDLLFKQWGAKQNPEWHPEGNTLKHIIVVLKRAYHHYPDDPNMIMAALFHDLGKLDTYGVHPKTGHPTAYGHEYKSTDYVEQFRSWIESFEGTDVDEIKYLVKNHMKVKPRTWGSMRDTKKEPIMKNKSFDKLMGFTDKLDGGGTDLKESIKRILREETTPITKVISHLVDQHYNVGYEDEVNRKFLLLTITLTPKTDKSKRYGNIIFYSSWEEDTRRRGQIKNYDTNSAYNEGGMFKPMGLEKALSSWLYEKSKEIANNLKDKIIRDIY